MAVTTWHSPRAKPKSDSSGGSGSGRVPFKESEAIKKEVDEARKAANEGRSVVRQSELKQPSSGRVPFKTSAAIRSDVNEARSAANEGRSVVRVGTSVVKRPSGLSSADYGMSVRDDFLSAVSGKQSVMPKRLVSPVPVPAAIPRPASNAVYARKKESVDTRSTVSAASSRERRAMEFRRSKAGRIYTRLENFGRGLWSGAMWEPDASRRYMTGTPEETLGVAGGMVLGIGVGEAGGVVKGVGAGVKVAKASAKAGRIGRGLESVGLFVKESKVGKAVGRTVEGVSGFIRGATLPIGEEVGKAAGKVAPKTTELLKNFAKSEAGVWSKKTARGIGITAAVGKGADIVFEQSVKRKGGEYKEVLEGTDFGAVVRNAMGAEREAIAGYHFLGSRETKVDIPIKKDGEKVGTRSFSFSPHSWIYEVTPAFSPKKDVYYASVEEQLRGAGFDESQVSAGLKLAKAKRTALTAEEAFQFLNIASLSEGMGQDLLRMGFKSSAKKGEQVLAKNIGGKMFKVAAPRIAAAGVFEGAASILAQDLAREEPLSAKRIAMGAAFGGASAGLIGGLIAGTAINKPKTSKVIEIGAYVSDPYEYAGDRFREVLDRANRRLGKFVEEKPVVVMQVPQEQVIRLGTRSAKVSPDTVVASFANGMGVQSTLTGSSSPRRTSVKKVVPKVPTLVNVPTPVTVKSSTPVNLPNLVSEDSFLPFRPDSFVPVDTMTNTDTETPTKTDTTVPVNPFVNVDVPVNPFVDVNVPTNVPTDIPVFVNIPSRTPQMRLPPLLPFQFPTGFGEGVVVQGKRKRYVDELEEGRKILSNMFQGSPLFGVPAPSKRGKKRK